MSILDKLRRSGAKAKEQAEQVVEQHGDKIAAGLEKTGEVASKVTGHRFDDKIDKGVSKAKERLEQHGDDASASGPAASSSDTTTSSTSQPPPTASEVAADSPPSDTDADEDAGSTT